MTDAADTNPGTTILEIKFTSVQIEENCPLLLQDLGKRIAVHSEKARKCEDKAGQHYTTISKLLATAHGACDDGGFKAFQKIFFPDLGKSRVYELLAIGTDKKSVEEIRASNRKRQVKHRANKAADAQFRYSNGNSEPDAPGELTEHGAIEAPSIVVEQTPGPAKPRSSATPGDEALRDFTVRVLELDRTTKKKAPDRFSKTAVPLEVLERVGKLLIDIAKLKKSRAVEATLAVVLGGTVSDDQPAVHAEHAAPKASIDGVA
jgi:hypothetical protein